jgi:hypothetical protein
VTTAIAWMLDPDRHCKGSTLMFPEDSRGVIAARRICFPPGGDPCPVWQQCKEYALTNKIEHGVWAGMSMRARIRTRRGELPAREPVEHGTDAGYNRHYRHHERPCDDCTQAHSRVRTDQKRNRRTRKTEAA